MNLIHGLSTLSQAIVVIIFFSGATILGLYIVRRLVPAHILREEHEIAGYTFGVVGAFYGVVLAFVIVAAWQRFERANAKAQAEALALTNLYSLSKGFPEPMRKELAEAAGFYAKQVVNHEWDQMATLEFERSLDGEGRLWKVLLSYNPRNALETGVLAKCLDEMDALSDARQLRYVYYKEDLPGVVWLVIYAGCIITIGFSYSFGSQRFVQQAVMSGTFAALIGLTIMAISELANPYQGAVTVTNAPFQFVLKIIQADAAAPPVAANPSAPPAAMPAAK